MTGAESAGEENWTPEARDMHPAVRDDRGRPRPIVRDVRISWPGPAP